MKAIWPWPVFALTVLTTQCYAVPPSILITNLPVYGIASHLAGVVLNANPATNAVAVYIFVPGYGWVTKPTCAQPLTTIQPDGSWSANVNTGGPGDLTATRFAALLVSTNFNQTCVLGLPNLPTSVYAQASAKAVVTRPSPGVRFLSFSGYDWWVKNSTGTVRAGAKLFFRRHQQRLDRHQRLAAPAHHASDERLAMRRNHLRAHVWPGQLPF